MLLIGADGEKVGEIPIQEALALADEAGLDLVEVASQARPPVCKIMDFGKYKYLQKRKQKGRKSHSAQVKEIRMRPKTSIHDLEVKARRARTFLAQGDKVLVTVVFRGREIANNELGKTNLMRFAGMLEDDCKIEGTARMEGRRMHMTLAPK